MQPFYTFERNSRDLAKAARDLDRRIRVFKERDKRISEMMENLSWNGAAMAENLDAIADMLEAENAAAEIAEVRKAQFNNTETFLMRPTELARFRDAVNALGGVGKSPFNKIIDAELALIDGEIIRRAIASK